MAHGLRKGNVSSTRAVDVQSEGKKLVARLDCQVEVCVHAHPLRSRSEVPKFWLATD